MSTSGARGSEVGAGCADEALPAPPANPPPEGTSAFPAVLQPLVARVLEGGSLVVVLLEEGGTIRWASRTFRDAMAQGKPVEGQNFLDLLEAGSSRLLRQLGLTQAGGHAPLDLRHVTPSGHRSIKYQFFRCAGGCLGAIGSDRTEEVELIEQMSALIEDLHREIENRDRLSRDLERMAITDFLTGIANRRQFDKIIQDEWGRMKRYGSHFALLLVDLDHFKEVNDAFGHQVGDEVLKCVVDVLRRELRSEDIVARYGGEEFAIIALAASAETGRELAERLRRKVEEASMPAGVSRMTITVGVAATGAMSAGTLAQLIAGADEALYRGKQAGRNRVELYRPSDG